MVTAGIFMVARMSPLFEGSDTALSFVLVIGATTALFMGFLGIIQNDIKRVVAYSTLSQLGYMTVALGVSAYSAGVFHLMTHAFFKALLFLAAGSVIIGMHHDQDIRNMGGLRKYMPITWITSLIGSLALIGTPFFSGFYSKDSIILAAEHSHIWGAGYAQFAVLAGVFDQSLAMAVPPYAASQASWRSDEAFVRDLEHRLPDRAMVFQVPYVAFPESGMDLGVFDADQLKLSLRSTRLRWSGGSFKGQPDTQWQPKVSGLPADQAVRLLAALQFDAVVIDRNATKDRGAALEAAYTAATGATGQASADGRWVVFPLDRPRAQLQGSASPAQIADLRERVLRGEV